MWRRLILRSVWNDQDVCFVHIRVDEHKNSGLTNLPSYINVQLIRRSSSGGQRSISNSFITSRQVRASHLDVFQLITKKRFSCAVAVSLKKNSHLKKTDSDFVTALSDLHVHTILNVELMGAGGGVGGKVYIVSIACDGSPWKLKVMFDWKFSERTPRSLDYIHLKSSLWQTDRSNAPPFRFTMTRGSGRHWKHEIL